MFKVDGPLPKEAQMGKAPRGGAVHEAPAPGPLVMGAAAPWVPRDLPSAYEELRAVIARLEEERRQLTVELVAAGKRQAEFEAEVRRLKGLLAAAGTGDVTKIPVTVIEGQQVTKNRRGRPAGTAQSPAQRQKKRRGQLAKEAVHGVE